MKKTYRLIRRTHLATKNTTKQEVNSKTAMHDKNPNVERLRKQSQEYKDHLRNGAHKEGYDETVIGSNCSSRMNTQRIELGVDKDAAWSKVAGRRSVFLDTNCWIEMADEANDVACRVRDRLRELVSSGRIFCPLSWGLLEELFNQTGESLKRTARLMEELSMNVTYVMRTEVYEWEVARSVQRAYGKPVAESLSGLFAPVAAFAGSRFSLEWFADASLDQEARDYAKASVKRELGKISATELVRLVGESLKEEKPPAYAQAAKTARDIFKGDRQKLFLTEAGDIFRMYVVPPLSRYPPDMILQWMKYYGRVEGEDAFFRDCLTHFPALHNHIEIMMAADMQPDRKDKNNDFFDYEIVVAPLAYSSVFASRDKGISHLLRHQTKILSRTTCQYCDSLGALEPWLTGKIT
jgi:hypothetical protein